MKLFRSALVLGLFLVLPLLSHGASHAPAGSVARRLIPLARKGSPMQVAAGQTLSFDFVSLTQGPKVMGALGGGAMDIGSVSYFGGSTASGVKIERASRDFAVIAPVGVRIGATGASGTASVKAWLELPVAPYQVYLDNVQLGSQPTAIGSEMALGLTHHSLKIVVPRSVADSSAEFKAAIALEITAN